MSKTILANVQIQFDQFSEKDSEQYIMETIDKINEVLQREFNDISPIIFGNNIDSSDVEISEVILDKNDDIVEIGMSVDVDATDNNFDFNGTVDSFRNGNIVVVDGDGDYFEMESINIEIS